MKPVIKRGAALLAMVGVAFTVDRQAKAGVLGGFATEWTQLANNLQLINSYLRQGEQLTQEIRMVLDMARNTAQLPSQVFGPITSDIAQFGSDRSGRPSDCLLDGQSRRGVPQPVSRLGIQLAALGT